MRTTVSCRPRFGRQERERDVGAYIEYQHCVLLYCTVVDSTMRTLPGVSLHLCIYTLALVCIYTVYSPL